MARLHNLKDWGYKQHDYYELARRGYSVPGEIEIELDVAPRAIRTFATPLPAHPAETDVPELLGTYVVMCVPVLLALLFWLLSGARMERSVRMPTAEIAPISWLMRSIR